MTSTNPPTSASASTELPAPAADASAPKSLPEAHGTLAVWKHGDPPIKWWRKLLGFAGPGFMVSVGYMDPGNWGTDLAAGSQYGYALLWVILASNLMAIFLQILCARLGIVTGMDLAQACRFHYSKPTAIALWFLCELAIIACDLAEVIGAAVALKLLFGIPLVVGVLITGLDVLLLLMLIQSGFRKLEAIVITLVATIAACFALNIYLCDVQWGGVAGGLFQPSLPDTDALVIALGILGATVMPHNLYLHTAIVQTRKFGNSPEMIRSAVRFNTIDTVVALSFAFFVNAAILVLAAAVFHGQGIEVEELEQAHEMLKPALGGMAATAFAVALLCSGQSSTITGTLAGQIVMEGFLNIRVQPWLRRLITRSLAIVPAVILISISGGHDTVHLLIVSQVVLSMQLPFAIFPLLHVTSKRAAMGEFVNPTWVMVVGYVIATVISGLNVYLLWNLIGPEWVAIIASGMLGFAGYVRWTRPRRQSAAAAVASTPLPPTPDEPRQL